MQAEISSDSESNDHDTHRPAIDLQLPSPEKQLPASTNLCSDESPATAGKHGPRKISLSKSADSCLNNGSPTHVGSPFSPLRPSSPLLSVLREAVESLSCIEDFEKLEMIGSGFFAEVFKVSAREGNFTHGLITRCAYAQGKVKRLSPSICLCQKTRLFAVLPLENRHEIALYRSASQFIFFERCLESRTSLLSSAMAMGF